MSEYNKKLQDLSIKDAEYELKKKKMRDILVIGVVFLVLVCIGALIYFAATKGKRTATEDVTTTLNSTTNYDEPLKENFADYVNTAQPLNSPSQKDISVTIIDMNGNISTSASSSIASIYKEVGYNASSTILRSSFTITDHFTELKEANSTLIESLGLRKYVDYLALGSVTFEPIVAREETELKGYKVKISVSIISTKTNRVESSFDVDAFGNGFDGEQAKNTALKNATDYYKQNYSSLN